MTKCSDRGPARERLISDWTRAQLMEPSESEHALARGVLRTIPPGFDARHLQGIDSDDGAISGDILDGEAVVVQSIGSLAAEAHESTQDAQVRLTDRADWLLWRTVEAADGPAFPRLPSRPDQVLASLATATSRPASTREHGTLLHRVRRWDTIQHPIPTVPTIARGIRSRRK